METIQFDTESNLATIRLNRPECLNSFNLQMHQELISVLKNIQQDDAIRCLLITGAGRGFCAGQDLKARQVNADGASVDLGESLEKYYNPLIRLLVGLPKPVVCAVNGVAAGAGANLALCCDIVLASRSAYFVQAFSKIGLIPDSGGTWLLPRLVGRARAFGLAMLAEKISAEQAEDWGMIWQCVDDEVLESKAKQLAHQLAERPTQALGFIKRAIQASAKNSFDEQLDLERDLQTLAGRTQ